MNEPRLNDPITEEAPVTPNFIRNLTDLNRLSGWLITEP